MAGFRTSAPVVRRLAALSAAGLTVTLLSPLVGPAAQAAPETCPGEAYDPPLMLTGCDDTQPPTTSITSVSPAPTAAGFTGSSSVTFTFAGTHAGDDDTGTIAFECQLFDTDPAIPPTTWETCASPQTYSGLGEYTTSPYTFRVRAVDATDEAIAAGGLLFPDLTEHDWDTSPEMATVKVDSLAPNTFVNREPVDRIRPDWPVVLTPTPVLELNSNEPAAGITCTVNGHPVTPCGPGAVTLGDLEAGDSRFVARAVDRGGNLDPTPATTRFFVPADIKPSKGSGWKNVRRTGQGLFGDDYVEATKVGRTLVITRIKKVREVRLVASVGPRAGTIQVRVGRSQWYTVDLHSKKARTTQILVRDEFSPLQSGTIQIRVASLRGTRSSVRLDALVARG